MNRREFLKSMGCVSIASFLPVASGSGGPKLEYMTFGSDKAEIEKMLQSLRRFDNRMIESGYKIVGKSTVIYCGMSISVQIAGVREREAYREPDWWYVGNLEDFELEDNMSFFDLLVHIGDDPFVTQCGVVSRFSGVRIQNVFDMQTYKYRHVSDMYMIKE